MIPPAPDRRPYRRDRFREKQAIALLDGSMRYFQENVSEKVLTHFEPFSFTTSDSASEECEQGEPSSGRRIRGCDAPHPHPARAGASAQMKSWIADSFISSNAVAAPIGSSSPSSRSSRPTPMRSIVIWQGRSRTPMSRASSSSSVGCGVL